MRGKDSRSLALNYLKLVREDLVELKPYLIWIVTLFLVSLFIGFMFHTEISSSIERILDDILSGLDQETGFGIVKFIIWNNLKATFLGIVLGVVFGIFPLFGTSLNGVILGSVMRMTVEDGSFSAWKIIPHGIFELPAVLLALAMGTKLGVELLRKDFRKRFVDNALRAVRIFALVVVPLIILAGFIEGLLIVIYA